MTISDDLVCLVVIYTVEDGVDADAVGSLDKATVKFPFAEKIIFLVACHLGLPLIFCLSPPESSNKHCWPRQELL